MKKHLDRWFTVVFALLLTVSLLLTIENRAVYAAPYDVKIDARDSEHGWIAVRIGMDGQDTGFYTPHTFTVSEGTHTFTVPNADSYENLFSMWSTRWRGTTLTVSSGGTYIADYYPEVPHSVIIQANENTRGYSESVPIAMDGLPTGFTTPHTFTDLIGTRNFTVPNSDSFGVPFGKWEEIGWTDTTITVGGEGGIYTANYYYPPYNATILGWDSVYGGMSEPLTKDGTFAGIIPMTFTGLTGPHNFTLPSTNSYGHQFTGWNTGETSNTISIIFNGTYTAYYALAPTPTPTASPTPSPSSTPPASPTPKPTSSPSSTPTPTPTKTVNPTAKPSSTPGSPVATTSALPAEAFYAIGVLAGAVIVAAVLLILRRKKQKGE